MIQKEVECLYIYHYFLYRINYLYLAALLSFFLIVTYRFYRDNRGRIRAKIKESLKEKWIIIFFFYLSIILISTIFARRMERPINNIIGQFGLKREIGWDFEIIMNILLFLPYTFLFIVAFKPQIPWKASIILSGITTIFIELSQLLFWLGSFQLSDIVHNFLGGMLGCGIWYTINWRKKSQNKKGTKLERKQ